MASADEDYAWETDMLASRPQSLLANDWEAHFTTFMLIEDGYKTMFSATYVIALS